MPTSALTRTSEPPGSPIDQLVRERLARLAECIRKDGAPYPLTPQLVSVCVDVFQRAGVTPEQTNAMFDKAERTCKFWPTTGELLGFVEHAKEAATTEAADQAWQYVLDLRRMFWNPDMPGGFSRGMPKLSPRIERACRAAGVFRDHESVEALHVWAKKKFIESFLRWDETRESENLLPDGEIKELLTDIGRTKALAYNSPRFERLHQKGLADSKETASTTAMPRNYRAPQRATLWDSSEERQQAYAAVGQKETNPVLIEKIRGQQAALLARYPKQKAFADGESGPCAPERAGRLDVFGAVNQNGDGGSIKEQLPETY